MATMARATDLPLRVASRHDGFGLRGSHRQGVALGLTASMLLAGAAARAQGVADFPSTPTATESTAAPALPAGSSQGATDAAPAATVTAIPSPLVAASPLLPVTGANIRSGDLRDQLAASLLGPPLDRAVRNWTVSPSLGVGEEYTSNAQGAAASGRGYDFISLIQPGLAASGTTTRLQGSLAYHPEIDIYARAGQIQVDQNFAGSVLATLVPGNVFLDLKAYGSTNTNGLATSAGTSTATSNAQTQTLSFSATPYALQRFGGWGSGEVGATLAHTSQSGLNSNAGASTDPFFTSGDQSLTSYGAHAAFVTGEEFGRYNGTALLSGLKYDGTGVLTDASRSTASLSNGYAITRLLTALGDFGYERIRYGGTDPLHVSDPTWNVGFRLTLGPESSVQAEYGHHDGFNAASLDATLQPTARTRLYLRYSKGLDTEAEQVQAGLANSDFDQLGDPVDHTTGAPVVLADSFFGSQTNLYRTERLSLTGMLLQNRDIFSATLEADDSTLVSSSGVPGSLGSNKGLYGTLNWAHDLSPTLSLSTTGQYGVRHTADETEHVTFVSVALVKTLSDTLAAQLRYTYNHVSGGQPSVTGFGPGGLVGGNFDQSLVLLTLVKSF